MFLWKSHKIFDTNIRYYVKEVVKLNCITFIFMINKVYFFIFCFNLSKIHIIMIHVQRHYLVLYILQKYRISMYLLIVIC